LANLVPDILIVEDQSDLRELIFEFLCGEGYSAATAVDGGEALRLLRSGSRPRLILLDRYMPVLDGRGFLAAAQALLVGIPVVELTAVDEDLRHPAVVGTLRKPFDLDQLLQVVRSHARQAAAQ
jgi:CheY-like chemotaxis protein